MKKFLFPLLLLSFLLGVFFPAGSFAGGDRGATILYTGFVRGNTDPIHG